jgi:hypothetical protein
MSETQEKVQSQVVPVADAAVVLPGSEPELKPERVQGPLTAASVRTRLTAEKTRERLKSMPGWRLDGASQGLTRIKMFPTPQGLAAYTALVTVLAREHGLPATVRLAGAYVEVTLFAPLNRGRLSPVTETVIDVASQLG